MPGDKNHPVRCSGSEAQGESLFWAKKGGLGGRKIRGRKKVEYVWQGRDGWGRKLYLSPI